MLLSGVSGWVEYKGTEATEDPSSVPLYSTIR